LQQVIDQQLNPVDIVNPVALQQVIDQQLNAVDILQPGDITQKVQQQLQPLQPVLPDNVVQFVQPINKGKPDNAPQSVPTNYPSHGNAALQIQPQQQAAAATNIVNHNNYHITINQQPGEDAQALTDRIIRELKRRDAASKRGGLYDHG
jgi:lipoprotein-anchoring transpeptidase ErfK/SrfK